MVESAKKVMPDSGALILLLAIFSAAICAIVYQFHLGSLASYFLGNSVEQTIHHELKRDGPQLVSLRRFSSHCHRSAGPPIKT